MRLCYAVWKEHSSPSSWGLVKDRVGRAQVSYVKISQAHKAIGGFNKYHIEYSAELPRRERISRVAMINACSWVTLRDWSLERCDDAYDLVILHLS